MLIDILGRELLGLATDWNADIVLHRCFVSGSSAHKTDFVMGSELMFPSEFNWVICRLVSPCRYHEQIEAMMKLSLRWEECGDKILSLPMRWKLWYISGYIMPKLQAPFPNVVYT